MAINEDARSAVDRVADTYGEAVKWAADATVKAVLDGDPGGDLTLKLEPDSIMSWLDEFGRTLKDITACRRNLLIEDGFAAGGVQLGSFPPSQQIAAKMVDRMGESEGGMAWALEGVLLRLADIHEALRQSLAAQLDVDLDNQKIIDHVRSELD